MRCGRSAVRRSPTPSARLLSHGRRSAGRAALPPPRTRSAIEQSSDAAQSRSSSQRCWSRTEAITEHQLSDVRGHECGSERVRRAAPARRKIETAPADARLCSCPMLHAVASAPQSASGEPARGCSRRQTDSANASGREKGRQGCVWRQSCCMTGTARVQTLASRLCADDALRPRGPPRRLSDARARRRRWPLLRFVPRPCFRQLTLAYSQGRASRRVPSRSVRRLARRRAARAIPAF
jgi:hypothetical protein